MIGQSGGPRFHLLVCRLACFFGRASGRATAGRQSLTETEEREGRAAEGGEAVPPRRRCGKQRPERQPAGLELRPGRWGSSSQKGKGGEGCAISSASRTRNKYSGVAAGSNDLDKSVGIRRQLFFVHNSLHVPPSSCPR